MSPKKVKNRQNFQLKRSEAISGVLLIIAISALAGFFIGDWVGADQSAIGYSLEDDEKAILIEPSTSNQTFKIKAASLWTQKDVLGSRIIYEQMLVKDMHDYDANLYLGTILKDYSKPPDLERAALC